MVGCEITKLSLATPTQSRDIWGWPLLVCGIIKSHGPLHFQLTELSTSF